MPAETIHVCHLMTEETAEMLRVSPEEIAKMQAQHARLHPAIHLCRGLSEHTMAVMEQEAAYGLDVERRKANGHQLHRSGSPHEKDWPFTITDDGAKQPHTDGFARIYAPLGGQPSETYEKLPLKIEGACDLQDSAAYLIIGKRAESHVDKRIHNDQIGMLGQGPGHVVYVIKGKGVELHVHRKKGDVHFFSRDIATGAFELYMDADGFAAIRLLDSIGATRHGAVAAGGPRIQLCAQHVMAPTPEPVQVHARAAAPYASPRRVHTHAAAPGLLLHPSQWLASLMPHSCLTSTLQVLDLKAKEAYTTLSVTFQSNKLLVMLANTNKAFDQLEPRTGMPPLNLQVEHVMDVISRGAESGVYLDNPNGSSYPKLTSDQARANAAGSNGQTPMEIRENYQLGKVKHSSPPTECKTCGALVLVAPNRRLSSYRHGLRTKTTQTGKKGEPLEGCKTYMAMIKKANSKEEEPPVEVQP